MGGGAVVYSYEAGHRSRRMQPVEELRRMVERSKALGVGETYQRAVHLYGPRVCRGADSVLAVEQKFRVFHRLGEHRILASVIAPGFRLGRYRVPGRRDRLECAVERGVEHDVAGAGVDDG